LQLPLAETAQLSIDAFKQAMAEFNKSQNSQQSSDSPAAI